MFAINPTVLRMQTNERCEQNEEIFKLRILLNIELNLRIYIAVHKARHNITGSPAGLSRVNGVRLSSAKT